MQSASSSRRALTALCLVATLALGLGLAWSWCGAALPGLREIEQREAHPLLAALERPGDLPTALSEPSIERAHVADPLQPAAIHTESANMRLRFMQGSSGLGAPNLSVELFASGGRAAAAADAPTPAASGASDAQGFFRVPVELAQRGFTIGLQTGARAERWSAPASVMPDDWAAAPDGILEIAVFGEWARFEALVLDERGSPASGALVQFDFESPALAYSTRDSASIVRSSDERGLAHFALLDPASVGGRVRIKARGGDERFSEVLELPPPLASTRVQLTLSTTAGAIIQLSSSNGAALSGAMARLERVDVPSGSSGRSTDRQGLAKFKPLEPGRYAASAQDPSTGSLARKEFDLLRCQMAEVQLELPPSELPRAIAGSVRTLDGRPVTWLTLSICVDGREEARVPTDAEGNFVFHRAPCEQLRVRVLSAFDGPRIEPELIEAKFGATDVNFVLSDPPRLGMLALRVVERGSQEPLRGVAAAVFRDSAAERIGGVVSALAGSPLHLGSNEAGLLLVPHGPGLPRAKLVVEKRGFVRRELELSELEQLPVRAGLPLLELERGWLQRWVVLDRKTGKPVVGAIATHAVDPFSGASLHDGSTWLPSPPSDARGVVELMLSSPPARISIQAQGYEPRVLDVAPGAGVYGSGLSIADATVLLDSVAAVRSGVR
jgi:hypothetical protein